MAGMHYAWPITTEVHSTVVVHFYTALFSALEHSLHCCHMWFWMSDCISVVYIQHCLVVTWLVPREIAAVLAHVLCTPHNHAWVYSVISCKATHVGIFAYSFFNFHDNINNNMDLQNTPKILTSLKVAPPNPTIRFSLRIGSGSNVWKHTIFISLIYIYIYLLI